jgi:hypothetical protein
MSYTIKWHRENRIIHLRIWGSFTDEELITCSNEIRDNFLEVGIPPVHVICDVLGVESYPHNIAIIKKGSQPYLSHRSMGWFIFLGFDTPIMRFLANTIMQILMRNFKHARTMEDALAILCRVDPGVCAEAKPSV